MNDNTTPHTDSELLALYQERMEPTAKEYPGHKGGNPYRGGWVPDPVMQRIDGIHLQIAVLPADSRKALRAKTDVLLDLMTDFRGDETTHHGDSAASDGEFQHGANQAGRKP